MQSIESAVLANSTPPSCLLHFPYRAESAWRRLKPIHPYQRSSAYADQRLPGATSSAQPASWCLTGSTRSPSKCLRKLALKMALSGTESPALPGTVFRDGYAIILLNRSSPMPPIMGTTLDAILVSHLVGPSLPTATQSVPRWRAISRQRPISMQTSRCASIVLSYCRFRGHRIPAPTWGEATGQATGPASDPGARVTNQLLENRNAHCHHKTTHRTVFKSRWATSSVSRLPQGP